MCFYYTLDSFGLNTKYGNWLEYKMRPFCAVIKLRRSFGSQIALQEIGHAVCPSVCLSVCLLPKGSQTAKAVTMNLDFFESSWPGTGYRRKKNQNFVNTNFWQIFKVLNWLYCYRMKDSIRHNSLINIEQIWLPLERC